MKLPLGWLEKFSILAFTHMSVAVCMRCVHTHVMTVYLIQGTGDTKMDSW